MTDPVKAVLFDLDGTLLDTHALLAVSYDHAVREVLHKEWPEEKLLSMVGRPLLETMVVFADGDEEVGAEMTRVYRAYNESIHDEYVRAYDGIPEALAELADRGIAMGLVTSKFHKLAWRGLEVCGISKYLTAMVAPDTFPVSKPDPAPVLHGCELLGLDPSEVVYVGDSPFDVHAGIGAGCRTIACTWGFFTQEQLEPEHPTVYCQSAADLVNVIDSL